MTKSRYLKEKKGVEVTDISDGGHGSFEFWDPRVTSCSQWRYKLVKLTRNESGGAAMAGSLFFIEVTGRIVESHRRTIRECLKDRR